MRGEMYLGFYNFYRSYNRNRMFTDPSSPIGEDLGFPTYYLAQKLKELGHRVATIDTDDLEKFDAVVFLDYPTRLNPYFQKLRRKNFRKMFLFLLESPAIRPDNWNRDNHEPFKKVFTWNPSWADGKKYFHFHLPNKLPEPVVFSPSLAQKFCCTIASQKYGKHPNEIYTERVNAIRWFERNHPDEFDLLGIGWDRFFPKQFPVVNPVLALLYRKFPRLPHWKSFPSHRGPVQSKRATLRQYRFSLCYENSIFPGYLTEKIFDALFAGCVPVYLGDPEVEKSIPPEAFVNKKNFLTYEKLYDFLKNMAPAEYENYRQTIHKFVFSHAIYPFSAQAFADLVINEIVNDR
ncbi:MAG: glycosyltransferase family 10 [Verrucomicrobiota bacterium]